MNSAANVRLPISAFSVWEIPAQGVTLHLHLSAVEWLDYEIRESLRTPIERAEVGGLLLGRTEAKAWNKITIEGFTPVSCEHELGSLYHLSHSDKERLQEQLFRWKRGLGRNLYVVGFYRTHNRKDFSLDEEDLSLAKEYFSDSAGVFLLVKPIGQRDRVGGFFLCDEGHVERECNLIFPFSRSRLTRGETTLPSLPEIEEQEAPEAVAASYLPPEEREFEPEDYGRRPPPRQVHLPPEEREFEPEDYGRRPPRRQVHLPPEEKELEPEDYGRRPAPRQDHLPPEEREFEPEDYGRRPPPRQVHLPPEEKELEPEDYGRRPAPRQDHLPSEEKEFEPEELPPAIGQAELEFVRSSPPLFAAIESETPRWRSWAGRLLVAILILAVGATGYQLWRWSGIPKPLADLISRLGNAKPPSAPLPPGALGLEVELEGNSVVVSWNRDLPSIAAAKRGSLSIWDGKSTRDVPLGADQLRTGSVLLPRATSKATVRLQLIGANGEASESAPVTLVDNAPIAPSSESATQSRDQIPTIKMERPSPRSARGSGTRAQGESSSRKRNPEAAKPSKLTLARATPTRPPPTTSESSTRPPPPISSPATVEQKPQQLNTERDDLQRSRAAASEQVKPVPPPTNAGPAPSQSEIVQRPPLEATPKAVESARQPEGARTVQEQSTISREPSRSVALPEQMPAPSAGAPPPTQPLSPPVVRRSDYVPPRPVRQVLPSTPSNVRNLIQDEVRIDVRVEIDATGKVIRAEPVSKGKQDYLTAIALEAARQWRFSPARVGTQNVSSNTVVGFRFKKD